LNPWPGRAFILPDGRNLKNLGRHELLKRIYRCAPGTIIEFTKWLVFLWHAVKVVWKCLKFNLSQREKCALTCFAMGIKLNWWRSSNRVIKKMVEIVFKNQKNVFLLPLHPGDYF
jgi:hypothetical protein